MSYLDDTGLAYFWTKIKAYVSSFLTWANIQNKPSTFAPSAHSHGNITDAGELGTASRVVVTDGNKKVSVSSVTSTELGYLSGVTSNVQTQLNGKAASSDIPTIPNLSRTISGSGNAITDITVSGHSITAAKDATFLTSHQSLDGKMTRGSYERIQGTPDTHKNLNDYKTAGFYNVKTVYVDNCPSGIDIDAVLLVYPWDSGSYCTQELTESAASSDVRRWVRRCDNNVWSGWKQLAFHQDVSGKVNKSGDTMTGGLTITNSNTLKLKHVGITRGIVSSNYYPFFVEFKDNADNTMGGLYYTYDTNKVAKTYLMCYQGTTDANTWQSIGVGYNSSGNAYTWAPTPAANSNDTNIATTKWVKDRGYVDTSTNQTVGGTKTFSSRMLAPGLEGKDGDTGECYMSAQSESGRGAWVGVYGKTRSQIPGYVRLEARTEGDGKLLQCKPNGGLTWNGQTIQTSSDERIKTPIEAVSDDVLDGWEGVSWGQFKFLADVAEKGDAARLHVGLVAQQVDRSFKAAGADILGYGILCHEDVDESMRDLWMVRYTEALCMEAAYQRRENARLKKRVADLEERLAALELKIS